MNDISFVFNEYTKIWVYENIQIQEIEKSKSKSPNGLGPWWALTINNKRQVYESIYDVINELKVRGFHTTFRPRYYVKLLPT